MASFIGNGRAPLAAGAAGFVALWPVVLHVAKRMGGEMNFSARGTPEGVVLRHGIAKLVSQTVPKARVQAFRLTQSPLWRSRRWWRMDANVAGYGVADETRPVILPVGPFAEAAQVLWYLAPELVSPQMEGVWATALTGSGPAPGFVVTPRRARLFDPLSWRRRAYTVTPQAVIIRSGALVRTVIVVPHERSLAVSIDQGPWGRRLGLASVRLHSTSGQVVPWVRHLAVDDAVRLVREQRARMREASDSARPVGGGGRVEELDEQGGRAFVDDQVGGHSGPQGG
jgi:putative membrane protein